MTPHFGSKIFNGEYGMQSLKLRRLPLFIFAISYIVMLFADNESLKYLPIVITLFSVLLSGVEMTFACFCCYMFFSYPPVNAVALLIIAIALIIQKGKIVLCDRKPTMLIILFCLWLLVDSFISKSSVTNWNEWISWIYILIIVIICQNISYDSAHLALVGLQLSGLMMVVLQIIIMLSPSVAGLISNMSAIRIPDVNFRAIMYGICILITEYLVYKKLNNILFGICNITLAVFGVFALGSRGMMALLLLYFLMRYLLTGDVNINVLVKKIVIAIVAAIGVGFFLQTPIAQDILTNLQSISSTTIHSNAVRINLYKDIITKMIPQNFLFGVGPGHFTDMYPVYASIPFRASHAHSIYLQILSEDGIIGFVIIVSLICVFIKRTIKNLFEKTVSYKRTCAYVNLFFLVYGIVEQVWGDSRILGMFIIVNILVMSINVKEQKDVGLNVYNK